MKIKTTLGLWMTMLVFQTVAGEPALAAQDLVIQLDGDSPPQLRTEATMSDARDILAVAGYSDVTVILSDAATMSWATEITKALVATRVTFGSLADVQQAEAVLIMQDGAEYRLELRPRDAGAMAASITAIDPLHVELQVGADVPMRLVDEVSEQLAAAGVRRVQVRRPSSQQVRSRSAF